MFIELNPQPEISLNIPIIDEEDFLTGVDGSKEITTFLSGIVKNTFPPNFPSATFYANEVTRNENRVERDGMIIIEDMPMVVIPDGYTPAVFHGEMADSSLRDIYLTFYIKDNIIIKAIATKIWDPS